MEWNNYLWSNTGWIIRSIHSTVVNLFFWNPLEWWDYVPAINPSWKGLGTLNQEQGVQKHRPLLQDEVRFPDMLITSHSFIETVSLSECDQFNLTSGMDNMSECCCCVELIELHLQVDNSSTVPWMLCVKQFVLSEHMSSRVRCCCCSASCSISGNVFIQHYTPASFYRDVFMVKYFRETSDVIKLARINTKGKSKLKLHLKRTPFCLINHWNVWWATKSKPWCFFSVYKMQYILLLNKKENEHFGQELA